MRLDIHRPNQLHLVPDGLFWSRLRLCVITGCEIRMTLSAIANGESAGGRISIRDAWHGVALEFSRG
jgi:hypothetical protein